MRVTIHFGPNAKRASVSQHALNVLEDVLLAAGLTACTISSTARTPFDQARIMFGNLAKFGAAHQKRLYAAAGDMVIDVYNKEKIRRKPEAEIIAAMEAKIIEIGPTRISHHCADPKLLCVIDVAPSSVADKSKFEAAARADHRVSRFLTPPMDPAYHLEIENPK